MGIEHDGYKRAGDEAFTSGRYDDAYAAYEDAAVHGIADAGLLCNKSLAAFKLGRSGDALLAAEAALELLANDGHAATARNVLIKAHHRRAQALAAMGRTVDAVRAYKAGVAQCGPAPELHAALRLLCDRLPTAWLARYWAQRVEAAQAPHRMSPRDGVLLRPVPVERRLGPAELEAALEAALEPAGEQREARDLACAAWAQARRPGRAEVGYIRGLAYLQAGDAQQAERDALVALAYGPRAPVDRSSLVPAAADADGPPPPADRPRWAAALALQSAALEARGDNVPAILAAARAAEADPACERAAAALERLSRRVPEEHAAALAAGGAAALEAALAGERERARPEFLRRRPKYYYYYEWMRRRLGERHPELPAPVVDKLLTMDANELDLLLQYPAATDATVARVMGVWERGGAAAVEGYQVPLLSWEEVSQLREGATPGTLLEAPAPRAMLEAPAAAEEVVAQGEEASRQAGESVGNQERAGAGGEVAGACGGGGGESALGGEADTADGAESDGSVSLDLDDDLFELD